MSSNLNTKITSYTLNTGIEFDYSYALPPTQTGSVTSSTGWTVSSTTPTYESTVGPYGGSGSWKFDYNTSTGCRVRNNDSTFVTQLNNASTLNGSFTFGFWIKFNTFPTYNDFFQNIFTWLPVVNYGFGVNIGTPTGTSTPTFLFATDGTQIQSGLTLSTGQWYFVAVTRDSATYKFYVDNALIYTRTSHNMSATGTFFNIGGVVPMTSGPGLSFNISNMFIAKYSNVGTTPIGEIYTVGSTPVIPANITAAPLTASADITAHSLSLDYAPAQSSATSTALITHPTIIVVIGDHVEITTSISVNAYFPDSISVGTIVAVQNSADILTASALIMQPSILANTGVSFDAHAITADAEMVASLVSPGRIAQPMVVTATMPSHLVSFTPNYKAMVLAKEPAVFMTLNELSLKNYGTIGDFGNSPYNNHYIVKNTTFPMNYIGDGKVLSWDEVNQNQIIGWKDGYQPFLKKTELDTIFRSGNFAIEFWIKVLGDTENSQSAPSSTGHLLSFGELAINPLKKYEYLVRGAVLTTTAEEARFQITYPQGTSFEDYVDVNYDGGGIFGANQWTHIVINFTFIPKTDAPGSEDAVNIAIRKNTSNLPLKRNVPGVVEGLSASSTNSMTVPWKALKNDNDQFTINLSEYYKNLELSNLAIYPRPLTQSEIIDNYSFITSVSPDEFVFASRLTATANFVNPTITSYANAIITTTPITANAIAPNSGISFAINNNINAQVMTASSTATDATVYWGWTIRPEVIYTNITSGNHTFLSNTYYNYVQTNIAPYRYVTFDGANESLDYGSDADYSVVPVTIGGTVAHNELSINGKSAKTAGTSYITDGVILNESEWNDSWGTGQNSYHSAFWFQRATDDTSTTGLRVLWNLNGYKDNQHVVLYQYQGKLHMQFNNGSGTWIEQDTTNGLDLFDYERHFVVIEFDHTNVNNNTVRLYVDAVLKMTVNLGTYTGSTTNAASADSGPNDEANNRARLSIGCLITPFASTALPVTPTNTKLIIDEVYWDKNSITSTMVTNLYNAMPGKTNELVAALPCEASATMTTASISTGININSEVLAASALFANATKYVVALVNVSSTALMASADMSGAERMERTTIIADTMNADIVFNTTALILSIATPPMLAKIELMQRKTSRRTSESDYGISVTTNGYTYDLKEISAYMKYLRIVARTQKLYKDMEIL